MMSLSRAFTFVVVLVLVVSNRNISHAQTTYTYSTTSSSNAWLSATNWSPNTNFPGVTGTGSGGSSSDVAAIGNFAFSNGLGINFNTASGSLSLGTINYTSATALTIGDSSGSVSGTLTLNGTTVTGTTNGNFANTIIYANSTKALTIANVNTGSASVTMNLALGSNTDNKIVLDNTGNLTVSSNIVSGSGTTPLTFAGAGTGTITLSGTNTFTGTVSLLGPQVAITSDSQLGNSNNNIVINGGRLSLASGSATLSNSRNIFLGSTVASSTAVGTSISTQGATTVLTYNGVLQDLSGNTGILVKQGKGTLSLGGVSTYSGNTAINNGTLLLTTGNNRLPTGTVVSVGQAASTNLGTFDLGGFNQTIAGLNSTIGTNASTTSFNTVTTSTGSSTLTLSGTGTYAYGDGSTTNSGRITGAVSLVISGSGTQTLGDQNSYTGGTTVNSGTLRVSNTAGSATGNGAVQVNSGATLASGTTGTISGNVTLASGSTLAPGSSAIGTLNLGGNLTLSGGSNSTNWNVNLDLSNSSNVSKVAVAGILDLIGITAAHPINLNLTNVGTFQTGTNTYNFATYSAINGFNFNGSDFVVNSTGFVITSYTISASNGVLSIQLTADVPEPSTVLLICAGASGLVRAVRRRRKDNAEQLLTV